MQSTTTLGIAGYAGVAAAVGMVAAAMVVLWHARHKSEDERVELPGLGKVGNPTCLTLGVCLMVGGYHVAAYSLLPVVSLVSIPLDRWWVVAAACGLAVGGSVWADRLERGTGA